MRVYLVAALAAVLAAGGGRLSAQEAAVSPRVAADSASGDARSAGWRHGVALPPALAVEPPEAQGPTLRTADGVVPFFSGLFGAMAGMFVANWWVRRNCEERCAEERLYMLILGGMAGALVGWLAGGGDLPDTSPPPFLRPLPP